MYGFENTAYDYLDEVKARIVDELTNIVKTVPNEIKALVQDIINDIEHYEVIVDEGEFKDGYETFTASMCEGYTDNDRINVTIEGEVFEDSHYEGYTDYIHDRDEHWRVVDYSEINMWGFKFEIEKDE